MFAPPIEEVGEWIEFTPVEFGSTYLGGWIPTWAINRRFENGSSTDFYYEHPFLLGVFGSAPGVNLEVAYQHAIKKKLDQLPSPLNSVGDKLVKELLQKQIKVPSIHIEKVKDVGVLPFMTEFNNFTKGMSGVRFSDRELLLLSDGGLLFNNPLPPLLRLERGLDIIIIFDYSAGKGVTEGNELKKIVEYAKNNNIPFPKIDDFSAAGKKAISVFKDADSRVPVIVYMPRTFDPERWEKVKDLPEFAKFKSFLENFNSDECINGGFCKTLNFEYTQEQTKQWSGYTEYCVAASKQELIDALKFAAERKK
jgi:hypothetical protein